jgi:alpha-1,3-rhamnosyl/mannosyltransferase
VRTAWDLQAVTGPRPTGLGYAVRLLLDAYTQYGGADGGPAEVVGLRPNATDTALRGVPDRLAWEQWRLPRAVGAAGRLPPATRMARAGADSRLPLQSGGQDVRAPGIDLLYCPALGAPLRCTVPRVAHVHDVIPLADPAQFRGAARWYWTRLLPACWRRCTALTVSNASLVDEVAARLGYPRARIHVVPYYALVGVPRGAAMDQEGAPPRAPIFSPDWRPVTAALQIADTAAADPGQPYFLTLASHEPRKNLALALRALATLRSRGLRPRLVCAGGTTAHTAELQALAQQLGVAEQVEWPGYVDRASTLALLAGATALLFVSTREGYGMPPQEAQALGTPVVLSDIACHRAVYADAARWAQVAPGLREPPPLVGVDDPAGLADGMARLLDDAAWRGRLSAAGRAYQATFTPQATAAALRAAFAAALQR